MTSLPHTLPRVRRILSGCSLMLVFSAPGLMRAQAPLIQYDFNEGAGTSAANSGTLGTGANLTLDTSNSHVGWLASGGTLTGTGSALTMDGASKNQSTGAYVTGDGTALNTGLSAFTITLWVNLTTAGPGDRLVGFADGANGFDFRLNAISGDLASLSLFVDGTTTNSSASSDVVGQWTFLAVTYDGSATTSNVAFYSGGASVGATALGTLATNNKGAVNTVLSGVTTALRVGSSGSTNTDRTPVGLFDDVRIYGSVLNASDIEAVRISSIAIPEPSSFALLFGAIGLIAGVGIRRRR